MAQASGMFHKHLLSVLPAELCQDLLHFASQAGFTPALVRIYGAEKALPSIRNNERLEWVHEQRCAELVALIRDAAGPDFPSAVDGAAYAGASRHLRMYHYLPGQHFKPHRDGHALVDGLESRVTVLAYLNDTVGGETVLMPRGFSSKKEWIVITPRAGDVLLFDHDIWHEGRPVSTGEKFVLRMDLLYRLEPLVN
jgi:prolyl 4-hydroxylase